MNTKQEQIKKLVEGRNEHLITWLSLEDWEELPSEDVLDDIDNAWHEYGDDTAGFVRYVQYVMGEHRITAEEIYRDLIRDPEARRKIISYDFPDGEGEYIKTLSDKYDLHGAVITNALSMVRANFRSNF